MARHVITSITDDLDGSDDASTVTFSLEGRSYEIDLSKDNRAALEKALAPFIAAGRSAGAASRSTGRPRRRGNREDNAAIREWARRNGHQVNERGRIPSSIVAAYNSAN
ncbi:histone-like nucleoid-structuring protein Lsr2 [Microbacterium rhizosphaerae]|uniref:Lsr2 family protein n=1 Tax=Microbacterium rhizosphaerae TaxID=1678237 RepID=A0ABZ0ST59_9MICO|nr:Lsr2 family protein [Microbacterium rhizosphaerae]WPR90457.1 Lsr2 family protein [Microbacterium rhizosphaerae]